MTSRDNFMTARATAGNPSPAARHSQSEMRGIFGALERLGYDVDSLLATGGLGRAEVEDPDAAIPAQACAAVLSAAYRSGRLKNLPVRLAMEMPTGTNPLLDYIVASSESVGEGLRRLRRYLRLVNPRISIEIREEEDPIRVLVESPRDRFGVELTVSLSIIRMRSESGNQLLVEAVSFRHQPEDAAEISRLLQCPVHTGSSWNGWALPKDAWRLPLRRSDPVMRRWLESKAARVIAAQSTGASATDEVRSLLVSRLSGGDMRLGQIAHRLATTPRTLQRRLAREGTSYDNLRDSVRKDAADELLDDTILSIGEIAYLLGYSESAPFHRACKRWFNATPQALRHRSAPLETRSRFSR